MLAMSGANMMVHILYNVFSLGFNGLKMNFVVLFFVDLIFIACLFLLCFVQRVAVSTAANICRQLPSDAADFVTEAVPLLTNLLQYQDSKVILYSEKYDFHINFVTPV